MHLTRIGLPSQTELCQILNSKLNLNPRRNIKYRWNNRWNLLKSYIFHILYNLNIPYSSGLELLKQVLQLNHIVAIFFVRNCISQLFTFPLSSRSSAYFYTHLKRAPHDVGVKLGINLIIFTVVVWNTRYFESTCRWIYNTKSEVSYEYEDSDGTAFSH